MPYWTCTLPLVSSRAEVKLLLPTVWRWARMARARVPDSKGTVPIEALFGL